MIERNDVVNKVLDGKWDGMFFEALISKTQQECSDFRSWLSHIQDKQIEAVQHSQPLMYTSFDNNAARTENVTLHSMQHAENIAKCTAQVAIASIQATGQ